MWRLSRAESGDAVRAAKAWSAATRRSISAARSNGGRRHGCGKSRHSASVRPAPRRPIDRSAAVAAAAETTARSSAAARGACLRTAPSSASCSQARNGARVEAIGLRLGQDGEQRIDARLDGPFAKELGAEAVNGVDVRFFERFRARPRAASHRLVVGSGALVSSASRRRSFSSPAAFSVNVTATICPIVARPVSSTRRIRFTSSVVFPRCRPPPRRPACRRDRRRSRARAVAAGTSMTRSP